MCVSRSIPDLTTLANRDPVQGVYILYSYSEALSIHTTTYVGSMVITKEISLATVTSMRNKRGAGVGPQRAYIVTHALSLDHTSFIKPSLLESSRVRKRCDSYGRSGAAHCQGQGGRTGREIRRHGRGELDCFFPPALPACLPAPVLGRVDWAARERVNRNTCVVWWQFCMYVCTLLVASAVSHVVSRPSKHTPVYTPCSS